MSSRRVTTSVAAIALAAVVGGIAGVVPAAPAHAAGVPIVARLSVTKGSTVGGTNLLISGSNFTGVSETNGVRFGAKVASAILVISETQIAVKAPDGTGAADTGQVDVRVTNAQGTSAVGTGAKFAYRQPLTATVPADTLLNSVSGSFITVGMDYTLSGSAGFTAEKITATVGGAAAVVTYADTTHVKIAVPAGTPSNTPTTVALFHDGVAGTPDTTNARYAAVITSLSRTFGPRAGGGAAITVRGKGFTGAESWKFGDNDATCTVTNDTTATCTVIPASDDTTPFQGAVSVSFTPAASVTFGYTSGGAFIYTDIS